MGRRGGGSQKRLEAKEHAFRPSSGNYSGQGFPSYRGKEEKVPVIGKPLRPEAKEGGRILLKTVKKESRPSLFLGKTFPGLLKEELSESAIFGIGWFCFKSRGGKQCTLKNRREGYIYLRLKKKRERFKFPSSNEEIT